MIKTILAYGLTLILGPISSGLIDLVVLLTISIPLIKLGVHKFFISFAGAAISAFVATWIGILIFHWLDRVPGILMLIFLGSSFLQYDLRRLKTRKDGESEIGYLIGDLVGIILGGYFLLYN